MAENDDCYSIDPKLNINNVHYNVKRGICDILDIQSKWRDLLRACEEIPEFRANDFQVERFASALHRSRSPSIDVWDWLGDRGMTVQKLVCYLERAKLERALTSLKPPEPIRIVQEPQSSLSVLRGEAFRITCEATGFPFPRYHWFQNENVVKKSINGDLRISHAKLKQAGEYTCRVHNSESLKKGKCLFTTSCFVKVIPSKMDEVSDSDDWDSEDDGAPAALIPEFTEHPESQAVKHGSDICLKCKAWPRRRLNYQWWKDGRRIADATDRKLKISSIKNTDAGRYWCTVYTGIHQEISSKEAEIKVLENLHDGIRITKQPLHSVTCFENDLIELSVTADGPCDLLYHWFKENHKAPIGTGRCLRIPHVRRTDTGKYHCYIEPEDRSMCGAITTRPCEIMVLQAINHRPIDKVALVIGNTSYYADQELPAVKWDVIEMSRNLENFGFRVLNLINLTKDETQWIVKSFKDLFVRENVYVVVYVAGHGFVHQGDHYLVPCDARQGAYGHPDDCINLYRDVQKVLQGNDPPSVLLFILDICREEDRIASANRRYHLFNQNITLPPEKITGNTVIIYPSSRGEKVYEPANGLGFIDGSRRHGIFYQHFEKILQDPKIYDMKIEDVFKRLQSEFDQYEKNQGRQYPMHPEMATNLKGYHCLGDPVNTEDAQARDAILETWQHYCQSLPPSCQLALPQEGTSIAVSFERIISNQMLCTLSMHGFYSPRFDLLDPPQFLEYSKETTPTSSSTQFFLRQLQRLRAPLNLQIRVLAKLHPSDSNDYQIFFQVALNLPLVASLVSHATKNNFILDHAPVHAPIEPPAENRQGEENEEPTSLEEEELLTMPAYDYVKSV